MRFDRLFVMLLITVMFASVGSSEAETLQQVYTFDRPTLDKVTVLNTVYDRITMKKSPNSGAVGEPAMPARAARILLPPGMSLLRCEVIPLDQVMLGRNFVIEPRPKPAPLSFGISQLQPPVPNTSIYRSSEKFPSQPYAEVGVQSFRGYPILILKLMPMMFIPATGELSYYQRLKVMLILEKSSGISPLFRGLPVDEQEIRGKIDNTAQIENYRPFQRTTRANYDLLILTIPSLVSSFQPLKAYHDAEGLETEIKTTADVGSTWANEVRNYIRTCYLQDGIQYVLIGADDDLIPAQDLWVQDDPGGTTETAMPADLFFGCLDGTYNHDGDTHWGEPTDGETGGDVDLIAEVYLGRAPVGNVEEANRFVTKTLWYLNGSHSQPDKVQLVGEYLGFGGISDYADATLDQLIDGSNADGYTTIGIPSSQYRVDRLYDGTWPTHDWPNSELIARLNSGVHLVDHLGHGDTDYAMKLYSSNLMSGLTNTDLFFVYSQTCYAGHFDSADCWAETVTIKTDHGAFAAVMNARYGYGQWDSTDGPSQRFNREFWDAVFNLAEGKRQLGKANQDSKEDNLYRISDSCMRWCYYELNLFGDPTVTVKPLSGVFIQHTPLSDTESIFPYQVDAMVMSTAGTVNSVMVYWSTGGAYQAETLTLLGGDNFRGFIPGQPLCSEVHYFLVATDTAGNSRRFPAEPAECTFTVATYTTLCFDSIEHGPSLWQHYPLAAGRPDQWAIRDHRNHTPGGGWSWKFGSSDLNGEYADNAYAALVSPSVIITEPSALGFWMWTEMETDYDGGWVELSVNGGPFTLLSPTGGYPFHFTDSTNQPCWSGNMPWTRISIDIPAPPSSVVQFRFCFKSDSSSTYEGWYIDDYCVEGTQCNATQVPTVSSRGRSLLLLTFGVLLFVSLRTRRRGIHGLR